MRAVTTTCLARLLAALACATTTASIDTVTVDVTTTVLSPGIIPANFVGFSQEVSDAPTFMGRFPSPPNAAFVQLMSNLREASGGGPGPQIRVGGNSADSSLWWPTASPLPPNQTYAITHADIASYSYALPLWNGSIVVDTSMFLQDNASWAAAHVSAVAAYMGWERVAGIEVGNEVECYHDSGVRPKDWSYASYVLEFEAHVQAMELAGMPRGRVQGAVFCCNNSEYNAALANYTATYAQSGVIASISYHRYALGGCGGKMTTMAELLADAAVDSVAAYVAPFAAAARAAGIPFRIGEGNSVSCGGRANVSDVFGVALWALDAMLASAAVGVSTFNFHGGPHAKYSPLTMLALPRSAVPEVRPLYYAMWAMAGLAAGGAEVMVARTAASNAQVKAWVTRDAAAAWHAVLIHKDPAAAAAASVIVTPPAPASAPASLARLRTSSPLGVLAPWNITWRGQTFDGSQDGRPIGAVIEENVPAAQGAYAFLLPPGTAAVLTWHQ